jgi:hypothetical protein
MVGFLRWVVIPGDPGGPDDADVAITFSTTDVRDKTTLADYTGELRARVDLRITDKLNGATGNDSATVSDTPYGFTIPCTATGGTANIGSSCSLTTSADALTGGTVLETRRTIWQLGAIEVLDGGSDGDGDTAAGNTVFLRQGVFIP